MGIDVDAVSNYQDVRNEAGRTGLWIALVTIGSVLGSWIFACAAPLVALAVVAGTRMSLGAGLALVGVAWFANQLAGFVVLDYPTTWDSFAWGALMGVASVAAFAAAVAAGRYRLQEPLATVIAFAVAFLAYELVLFAGTAVLPTADGMFGSAVVAEILGINLAALLIILVLHRIAVAARLLSAPHEAHA